METESGGEKLTKLVEDNDLEGFPEKPQEPLQSDCCGTGCTPCVFDIYDQELILWKEECEKIKLRRGVDLGAISKDVICTMQYKKYKIIQILQETHDSAIYRFQLPPRTSLNLAVGQHIILRGQHNSQTITRQYTPISDIEEKGYFDVLIKIYNDGKMSQYVKSWNVGHDIEWRGPFGNFTYKANKYRKIVMLAAGTGIAPMVQVIKAILNNEDDETRIQLLFTCKTYEEILCKKLLDQWKDFWNFSVSFFLSKSSEAESNKIKYGEKVCYGRITEETMGDCFDNALDDTLVLICGTKSFDKDMVNFVRRKGVQEKNIHKF